MKNKLIIVTGASKGLGLEITRQLISEKFNVLAISRSYTTDLAVLVDNNKDNLFFESFDFSDTKNISNFTKAIVKKYGRPFGLINNAAIGLDGVLATMHETEISQMIKVNIEAPILLTKYISRSMLINQEGKIINISSIIASTGFNGLSVYAATKSALNGFTKSLARELGKANITVNSIAPGYMETSMTTGIDSKNLSTIVRRSPLKRLAKTVDVAKTVSFLMSDASDSISGTIITVDAGSTS